MHSIGRNGQRSMAMTLTATMTVMKMVLSSSQMDEKDSDRLWEESAKLVVPLHTDVPVTEIVLSTRRDRVPPSLPK